MKRITLTDLTPGDIETLHTALNRWAEACDRASCARHDDDSVEDRTWRERHWGAQAEDADRLLAMILDQAEQQQDGN